MDQARTYQALVDGKTDINASYSTDAEIEQFGLVNLIDDKNYFPPYYVSPLLKVSFAEKHPELVDDLNALGDLWTEKEIAQYNYMVDQGEDPRAVAELMLREKGLL
jgi:glycine betaine/choline ABC-type transport system substrate-binding protein